MNDLVERRAAIAGIAVARAAVGTIPVFHSKGRAAGRVQSKIQSRIEAMFGATAGAENAIAASRNRMGRSTFAGVRKTSRHLRTS